MFSDVDFKPITLGDRELFQRYLDGYPFRTYEYSFLTLYMWRKYCNVRYAVLNDTLVIKKCEEGKGAYFMEPIGYKNAVGRNLIERLNILKKAESNFVNLFRDIEETFLYRLQQLYGVSLEYTEDTNNFDYLYDTERLITLSGRKLQKRKNQYRQFIGQYPYVLKDIHETGVVKDCLDFAGYWCEKNKYQHREVSFEFKGLTDVLTHLDSLPVVGLAVYVNDRIVGFTFGERINAEMGIVHVEKGDTRYKGIYAFLTKTFAEKYFAGTTYINKQEDLGISGLRKAKQAYNPISLVKKYVVNIRE